MFKLTSTPFFVFSFHQPQETTPDVFIWMLCGGKRVAYTRIPSQHIAYSLVEEERGKDAGRMQTVFLRVNSLLFKDRVVNQGVTYSAIHLDIYLSVGFSPRIGPSQGQKRTLIRVGFKPTPFRIDLRCSTG